MLAEDGYRDLLKIKTKTYSNKYVKSLANNSTTYNYLYYATRPKWLIISVSTSLEKDNKQDRNSLNQFKDFDSFKNQTSGFLTLWSLCQQIPSAELKKRASLKDTPQHIKAKMRGASQWVFQTKELLCWTSDLSFFNLRGYFSNILKALQVCRVTARNNRKVLFIKGANSSYAHSVLLNPWLQRQRQTLPQMLCSMLNASYLNCAKSSFFNEQSCNPLLSQINTLRNTGFKKELLEDKKKQLRGRIATLNLPSSQAFSSGAKSTTLMGFLTMESPEAPVEFHNKNNRKCFYQLNGLLSSCFTKTGQYSKKQIPSTDSFVVPNFTRFNTNNFFTFTSNLSKTINKHSIYNQRKKKERKINISSVIKLRIKEAQIMSQQNAGTQFNNSLVGFLTNSKITFNTAYSLSNFNYYYSISSNEVLNKKSSFWNPNKVKTDRLEKMLPLFFTSKSSLGYQAAIKRDPWDVNIFRSLPKPSNSQSLLQLNKGVYKKKQWAEHSYHHYYLSLASSIYGKVSLHFNKFLSEKEKKQKLVEHGTLGDIVAWRPKSQNISSAFYFNSKDSKIKEAIPKQGKLLESGLPILTGKFSSFFKTNRIVALKQKMTKEELRFTLMGQFLLFRILTKARFAFLKRAKRKIKKQSSLLKQIKGNKQTKTFAAAFLGSSAGGLLKKKAATFLNKGKRCNYGITYRKNYKRTFLQTYWYSPPFEAFFNKKKTKKESSDLVFTSLTTIPKRALKESEGLFKKNKDKLKTTAGLPKNYTFYLTNLSFHKYYKAITGSNYLKQYEMFVKSPFANNQLADIIFFINPEKTYDVVNQANCLKIPTIGIVSGITLNSQGRQGCNSSRLRESVTYPILGNPTSYFFIRTIIHLFKKALQTENYKIKKQNT